jgi:hypothetical protein
MLKKEAEAYFDAFRDEDWLHNKETSRRVWILTVRFQAGPLRWTKNMNVISSFKSCVVLSPIFYGVMFGQVLIQVHHFQELINVTWNEPSCFLIRWNAWNASQQWRSYGVVTLTFTKTALQTVFGSVENMMLSCDVSELLNLKCMLLNLSIFLLNSA